jgi:hypothetical protein
VGEGIHGRHLPQSIAHLNDGLDYHRELASHSRAAVAEEAEARSGRPLGPGCGFDGLYKPKRSFATPNRKQLVISPRDCSASTLGYHPKVVG